MWYKNAWRRHLCDMHIDEWSPEFLAQFDPEEYVANLKRANIQNAMLPLHSHVGLCYYPTKTGKMHNAFKGRESMMKRVEELCHEVGIAVTGYYSLIYNNYEHDRHPEWRMVDENGKSEREKCVQNHLEFAAQGVNRYGYCCPNNMEYRQFVKQQIEEMLDYFNLDGMFYDMLFWPQLCYCDDCRSRWEKEASGPMETAAESGWPEHDQKRKEWMSEFANWVVEETKKIAPYASVEHNFAGALSPNGRCINEGVNIGCDFAGGDLYENPYSQSFACKYYRSITNNQPFEYMFSRCEPNLGMHTTLKSEDAMASAMFLTAANHGATLIIDAIDPVGTLDERVYHQIGNVFEKQIPYETHLGEGEAIEDVGIYYSFRKKVGKNPYTNHYGSLMAGEGFIQQNVSYGVTGACCDIGKYKTLIAPTLVEEDGDDYQRLITYVENGGKLYISGVECPELLKTFFGAECIGKTEERVVYIAPNGKYPDAFDRFNDKYPLHFEGTAPKVIGMNPEEVIATITLPYTKQDVVQFASIHSNPPGVVTDIPAMAVKQYGKGKVLWSALQIECMENMTYKRVFYLLLKHVLGLEQTIISDAPSDVEVIGFKTDNSIQIDAVLLHEGDRARKVEDFHVSVKCEECPEKVSLLPNDEEILFDYKDGMVSFTVSEMEIFSMYEIK